MSAPTACIGERVKDDTLPRPGHRADHLRERIDDLVHVTDRPSRLPGRCYLIEVCARSEVKLVVAGAGGGLHPPGKAARRYSDARRGRHGHRPGGARTLRFHRRSTDALRPEGQRSRTRHRPPGQRPGALISGGVGTRVRRLLGVKRPFVADYVEQAGSRDAIPMASSHVRRIVEEPPATRCRRSRRAPAPRRGGGS